MTGQYLGYASLSLVSVVCSGSDTLGSFSHHFVSLFSTGTGSSGMSFNQLSMNSVLSELLWNRRVKSVRFFFSSNLLTQNRVQFFSYNLQWFWCCSINLTSSPTKKEIPCIELRMKIALAHISPIEKITSINLPLNDNMVFPI